MADTGAMQAELRRLQNMRKKLETGHGVAKQQGDTSSRLEWVNEQIKKVRKDIASKSKNHPGYARSGM